MIGRARRSAPTQLATCILVMEKRFVAGVAEYAAAIIGVATVTMNQTSRRERNERKSPVANKSRGNGRSFRVKPNENAAPKGSASANQSGSVRNGKACISTI